MDVDEDVELGKSSVGWQALHRLRRRMNASLARLAQIETLSAPPSVVEAGGEAEAKPAPPEQAPEQVVARSRPSQRLWLPQRELASATLSDAIRLMSARASEWDSARILEWCKALRQTGTVPTDEGCFRADAATMLIMSHAIEDRVIAEQLDCELYVGFQRLSLLEPQRRRYEALLTCTRCVCAYGVEDAPRQVDVLRHPRLLRFALTPQVGERADMGLLWFWFLVVYDPRFSTVLLAQQSGGPIFERGAQAPRLYQGFWSFDPMVTHELVGVLREVGRVIWRGREAGVATARMEG